MNKQRKVRFFIKKWFFENISEHLLSRKPHPQVCKFLNFIELLMASEVNSQSRN